MSRDLQFGVNYTWSKALSYTFNQWVDDHLTKNVTTGANANRPHAVNANFGYAFPRVSKLWDNTIVKHALDGWRLNGLGQLYAGTPFTITCQAQGAPIGYWTGTPTGGIPFRCQKIGDTFLPSGATPPAGLDSKSWVPFNKASFVLPPADSLGIGNTPPTLMYGPGLVNFDLALAKEFRVKETQTLEFKVETFNTFNHFNPNNPDTTLALNFSNGANTRAQFGTITGAQINARRAILSLRYKF